MAVLILLVAAAFHPSAARSDPNLIVGVGEDSLMGRPTETIEIARDLGIRAFRLSVMWEPGQTTLDPGVRAGLDNAVVAGAGMRIVLAVYGPRGFAPLTPGERQEYCSYVRGVLEQYPQINDVAIWNEPNLTFYWWRQFNPDGTSAAPAAYQDLLAHCWDVLHALRPTVNVIGPVVSLWGNDNPTAFSNVSHSPGNFIRKLGEAYRASGRTRPIIDTFGHHPHPPRATERPWKQHDSVYVSMGDWGKFMDALTEAFEGTAQPLPGQGPQIWWLEVGYQTVIDDDKRHLYRDKENWPNPIPDFIGGEPDSPPPSADSPAPDQATQLVDSIRLSYCQPYVEAFFNFLLWDERSLSRWQSGVLWVDGSTKGSYESFKGVNAEVNDRRVDCSRLKGGPPFIDQEGGGGAAGPTAPGTYPGSPDEVRPTLRPGRTMRPDRAPPLPSGFFVEATPSALEYTGTRRSPFGFVTLQARLSVNARPIRGKELRFVAGRDAYVATTDADGLATVRASRLPAGDWSVEVVFAGDPEVRPASNETTVAVFNSPSSVTSAGKLRAGRHATASFRVSFDGRRLRGRLRVRARGLDVRANRVTAVGLGRRNRSAWFAGFTRSGRRFWAHAEDNGRHGRRDRFRLWIGDAPRTGEGKVRSGNVTIMSRRPVAVRLPSRPTLPD